ncbi:MAG: DNA-directed RNA polymerase subunit omega [Omnitrophica WOR_2 bacterium GWA2_47_8]|nr:MAG: DNA-directed RNA polymerase subunit omega [Omnitrophica WOR_2 bacterium GWA2_47_8]
MGYQPLEHLLPKANYSVYKLILLAANRATELAEGKTRLIEKASSEKTATIALEEILAGRVVLKDVADKFKPAASGKQKAPSKKDENQEEQKEVGV